MRKSTLLKFFISNLCNQILYDDYLNMKYAYLFNGNIKKLKNN